VYVAAADAEPTPADKGVEGRAVRVSKSVVDACKPDNGQAFRWAACDRVNELLAEMEKEPRDEPWASATEKQLRAYAEAEQGKFTIRMLECRKTVCFIETASSLGGLPIPDHHFRERLGLGKEYPAEAFETDDAGVTLTITLFPFTRR
jgi:hypothetical protein